MHKKIYGILAFFMISLFTNGQDSTTIQIPNFGDTYSRYVNSLETGDLDIDYQDFRYSFIESEQFKIASRKSSEMDSLEKEMYVNMDLLNYPQIITIAKQILSIDYTNMRAHKILRQTYGVVDDTLNSAKYKTIQFGLLFSIVRKGDGQSCPTGWPVIQLSEEYFILDMIDAQVISQAIDNDGGVCDRMEVIVEGKKKTYYFETSKIFEGYKKLGF